MAGPSLIGTDRATLDWLGCATFRLRVAGLVLLLDAYVDRIPTAPPIGVTSADIDRCDWILIGHSHFDHLWGAQTILKNTHARVVGSYETARVLRDLGVPDNRIVCVSGGELIRLSPQVSVRVFPSLHSCVWTHTAAPGIDEMCIGDLDVDYFEQQSRASGFIDFVRSLGPEVLEHLAKSDQGARGDGGTLLYLIESAEGSVLFQDTAGCWSGLLGTVPRPDVAILAAGSRGNLDGNPIQGSLIDFLVTEVNLLTPHSVILSHHDDWLPGLTAPIDEDPIRKAVESTDSAPSLVSLGYNSGFPLFD